MHAVPGFTGADLVMFLMRPHLTARREEVISVSNGQAIDRVMAGLTNRGL